MVVAAEDLPADSADLRLALTTKRDGNFFCFCSHAPELGKKEILKNSFVDFFFLHFSICAMTTLSLISEKKKRITSANTICTPFWRLFYFTRGKKFCYRLIDGHMSKHVLTLYEER